MAPAAAAILLLAALPPRPAALGVAPRREGLAPQRGTLRRYEAQENEKLDIGQTNKVGVTRYDKDRIRAIKSKAGAWWPDAGARSSKLEGAQDLSDNVSWGWHHPNGIYATIPVGAPLIDASSNIYLSSDDAVRKFTASGELEWSYAPRGQIAAAPSLVQVSAARREGFVVPAPPATISDEAALGGGPPATISDVAAPGDSADEGELMQDSEAEEQLAPSWTKQEDASFIQRARAARAAGQGAGARADARHDDGEEQHWQAKAGARRSSTILVSSTTSGYVFAIDVDTGDEVWAVQASDQIAGVKGVVSGYAGTVLVATNRCTDRYCYRYRSTSNPLTPGNTWVRALSAVDGSLIWSFKPHSPVWNFVPQYGKNGDAVMFNDFEGAVYSMDLQTGTLNWKADGAMGTHTQASCAYSSELDQVFSLGLHTYDGEGCNPYVPKGIQPDCGEHTGSPGWVRGINASSGRMQWETDLPQPPASVAVGFLNTPKYHMRLVVSMGYNCHYGATSALWTMSPESGHPRVKMDGPTLWGAMCAGDREGGDIRRALGGRAYCEPGAWSTPVIDGNGDIFIGNQVGELQRLGANSPTATGSKQFELLSTLTTDQAFQDQAITLAPNIMAVATCTSLIVFHTYLSNDTFGINGTWEFSP
ncbi:unnamed protein product [Prorocentrum cordatum]|uniref:Pyrrolo-quinoline quinone repeat domain-containing protein n=1 Tax=Prorocentrum cordatum TaxID=2364126 RepID=A0ABN9TPJ7_9DINO|nr:unnamed protein product [Polarella glacialis]